MATIQTKFNVGEKAFTIDPKKMKIREFEIASVQVIVRAGKTYITYRAKDDTVIDDAYKEDWCFATRHELLTYIGQQ